MIQDVEMGAITQTTTDSPTPTETPQPTSFCGRIWKDWSQPPLSVAGTGSAGASGYFFIAGNYPNYFDLITFIGSNSAFK